MKYTVRFSSKAETDLFALYDYIATSSGDDRALAYVQKIRDFCLTFQTFPERGARWVLAGSEIRVVGFERRVSIAFRIAADQVVILRILYGGRNILTELGKTL